MPDAGISVAALEDTDCETTDLSTLGLVSTPQLANNICEQGDWKCESARKLVSAKRKLKVRHVALVQKMSKNVT